MGCIFKRRCNEVLNCVSSSSPLLGCEQGPGYCETCAMGFLTTQVRSQAAPHRSPYATIGKLVEDVGWKITRPGKGSGLSEGDIITHLNGLVLNADVQTAQRAIVGFGEYKGGEVILHVLRASGFRVEQISFDRN